MIIDSPIISGSYAASGSLNQVGNVVISGSLTVTGSIIGTASFAETASYLSGYVSPFPFTGSAIISGSFTVTGSANIPNITGSLSGSLNGTASYAVTASNAVTASYLTGYVSPFPFTGSAVISGSLGVTGSFKVTNLSGSGVRYLVADESGSVTAQSASAALKSTQAFTSTAGQTTFSVTNGYSTGYVDVFINGSKLSAAEFTDTSGTNIVLATGSFSGDVVEVVKYTPAAGVTNNVLRQLTSFTATAGQTVFSASYTPGLIDIFYNGSRLSTSDYTANNGTFFTLATASAANDLLDVLVYSYQVGAFNGIGGQGVTSQIAYFNTTSSITGSNNFTISGSTMTVTGSLLVSGSGTFTNIGPAILSGTTTLSGSAVLTGSLNVSGAIVTNSTITAQTLVVQTITSSVSVMTGSTNFGSLLANTHTFTGSLNVTGSLSVVTTGTELQVTNTGVRIGNVSTDVHPITGSVNVSGSATFSSSVDGTIFNSTSNAFRFSGNNAISLASLDAQNVVKINAAGYWGTQLVGANDSGILINNVGSVGIGITPPTTTNFNHLFVGRNISMFSGTSTDIYIGSNFYYDGGFKVRYSEASAMINTNAGDIIFQNSSSGTAGGTFNGIERFRITSTGNVGIGTSSPQLKLDIQNGSLAVYQNTASSNGAQLYLGDMNFPGGAYATSAPGIGAVYNASSGVSSDLAFYVYTGAMNSRTERMRILSGGGVAINSTSNDARLLVNGGGSSETAFQINDAGTRRVFCIPSQYYGYILAVSVASNGGKAISIGNAGGAAEVGSIVANASTTTYNTSSDYRLKEDLKDFNGLNKISSIKVYDFKWKDSEERTNGVLAHELAEVLPYAVHGDKDEIGVDGKPSYQGVDYSKIVPSLVKAIQEQQAQINELKAQING